MPSTHEARLLRNQRGNGVNAALKSLNKATIDSAVSSSTEYNDISTVTANDGYAGKGVKFPVRPVLAF